MGKAFSHRERVRAALAHREPDRIPIDFCSTACTAIVKQGYERLREHLNIEGGGEIIHRMQQVVDVGEKIKERFDVDFRGIHLGKPEKGGDVELGKNRYKDQWGVIRIKPPGSYYYDMETCPLSGEITVSDVLKFAWPDPEDPGFVMGVKEEAENLHQQNEYALVLNLGASFVHISQYMRGFQDWYIDCALNHKILETLFDAILDINLAICEKVLRLVGDRVDVVYTADDLGTQKGPQISPNLFRKLFTPRYKRYFTRIHDLTPAKVLFHTCGSVLLLLDDLIDAGMDILNPVQVSAAHMDTKALKERYGSLISFWGAIDTQRVLPLGRAEEVKAEVRGRIDDLAPGGGYVLTAVHNIQPDVPPENLVTMYDYAVEYGRYDGKSKCY